MVQTGHVVVAVPLCASIFLLLSVLGALKSRSVIHDIPWATTEVDDFGNTVEVYSGLSIMVIDSVIVKYSDCINFYDFCATCHEVGYDIRILLSLSICFCLLCTAFTYKRLTQNVAFMQVGSCVCSGAVGVCVGIALVRHSQCYDEASREMDSLKHGVGYIFAVIGAVCMGFMLLTCMVIPVDASPRYTSARQVYPLR
mmetsp:Transcript_16553/g.24902  ORF Transcript_16553/g.24902 Transcript_16553/m.24902 type:complete len:198 (-) Transcript_16553:115-708(-)